MRKMPAGVLFNYSHAQRQVSQRAAAYHPSGMHEVLTDADVVTAATRKGQRRDRSRGIMVMRTTVLFV